MPTLLCELTINNTLNMQNSMFIERLFYFMQAEMNFKHGCCTFQSVDRSHSAGQAVPSSASVYRTTRTSADLWRDSVCVSQAGNSPPALHKTSTDSLLMLTNVQTPTFVREISRHASTRLEVIHVLASLGSIRRMKFVTVKSNYITTHWSSKDQ